MRLLACLYVADRPLRLAYDPSCRSPIGQGGWFAKPEAMLAAERLTARGLLSRQVVERPPGGLEFIYALTDEAIADLTASGPKLERSDSSEPESVRATLERAIREASKTFADARSVAVQAGPASAAASGAVDPVATLDRLFVQSVRDVTAQANDAQPSAQDQTTAAIRSEAAVLSESKARTAPVPIKARNVRVDQDGAALKGHAVQALLDLIAPFPSQPASGAQAKPAAGRILLAEDVDVNRDIARAMLEASGYVVDAVTGGAEAVAAIQERPYGLVLMDVQMPGLAATRRIRALPSPQREVPIVGMSASASPSQAAAFREAGMSGHIDKPFRREDLQAAVERWRRLELPKSEPGHDASLQALDRAVYDSLFDLVGRERVMALLGQLAAQLAERFVGEPVSAEDRARLARDAHAMIPAAGVLGFLVLSGACKSLAAACAAGGDIGVPLDRVRASRAMTLKTISALKQAA